MSAGLELLVAFDAGLPKQTGNVWPRVSTLILPFWKSLEHNILSFFINFLSMKRVWKTLTDGISRYNAFCNGQTDWQLSYIPPFPPSNCLSLNLHDPMQGYISNSAGLLNCSPLYPLNKDILLPRFFLWQEHISKLEHVNECSHNYRFSFWSF